MPDLPVRARTRSTLHPGGRRRRPRATRALAVALLAACAACGDSPLTATESQAAEAREARAQSLDRDLLLEVLAKLDALEARIDAEARLVAQRLDSVVAAGSVVVAMVPPGDPGNSGNAGVSGEVETIRLLSDSIFELASWMASGMAQPWQGFQVCGGLEVKGAGNLKSRTEAKGEAKGGVGVKPADTGALADIVLGQKYQLDIEGGAEAKLGVGACIDLSKVGADPPVRMAGATPTMARSPGADGIEATLVALQGRLGLDPATLEQALVAGADVVQSGDPARLRDLTDALPLPAPLRDPVGLMRGRLTSFDPVGLLCDGASSDFGPRMASLVGEGCGFIQANDLPDLGTFLNLGSDLADLRDDLSILDGDLSGLDGRFSLLCGRFNNVVDRRLVVSQNLPWGGSNVLDVGLFPSSWKVGC